MPEEPNDGLLQNGNSISISISTLNNKTTCNFLAKNRYILFHFIGDAAEFALRLGWAVKHEGTEWDTLGHITALTVTVV